MVPTSHAYMHIHTEANLPISMSLKCGRKPTQHMKRTCKLHAVLPTFALLWQTIAAILCSFIKVKELEAEELLAYSSIV